MNTLFQRYILHFQKEGGTKDFNTIQYSLHGTTIVTKPHTTSAVAKVSEMIRRDVLRLSDGEFMGSEDELLARYKVSRPTLRQAASLVAQEQLVSIRRGVGGGYFARRPEARAVSRMAAVYLKAHDATLVEIVSAFMPIRVELARLSCKCEDTDLIAKLSAFLEHEHDVDADPHFRDFITGERKFNHLLGKMSGNKALALFLEILLDMAAMVDREEDLYRNRPERVSALRQERNRVGLAVLEHDEELATLAARRCARMSSEWLLQDLGVRNSSLQAGSESEWVADDFRVKA